MEKNLFSFKLGAKFILTIVVILSLTMGVSAFYMHNLQKVTFFKNLENQAQVQASFVASISEEAILSSDYISLDHIVRELVGLEDVVHSNITTTQGHIMTTYINYPDPIISALYPKGAQIDRSSISIKLSQNKNIFLSTQVIMVDKEVLGHVNIWVDKGRIRKLLNSSFHVQLINGVVIILALSGFIYLVFRVNVLIPIRNLMHGAKQVAQGHLDGEVIVTSNDELGILTNDFNTMTHNLRTSIDKTSHSMNQIQSMNQNLEDIVLERTARLELSQKIALMGQWDFQPLARVIEISQEARNILGFEPYDPITRYKLINRVYLDDRKYFLKSFDDAIRLQKSFKIEIRVVPPGSFVRYITISARADIKKQKVLLFGIIQDITEHKKAEESARKALVEKSNAESANKAKSVFLANMSHEIRTPLAAIIGFSEILLENNTDSEQKESLTSIFKNSNHLLNVINEILDLSKIESEKLEIEIVNVDIFALFEELDSVMKVQASDKNISIKLTHEFPLPQFIETDPVRFKQILFNLVNNAIKFTAEGIVRINVNFNEQVNQLNVEIVDTGIGIDQDKLKHLFTPFTQADSSTTRRFGGTGLGLYISKQLVKMLGGEIEIESVAGLGTKIYFSINTGKTDKRKLLFSQAKQNNALLEKTKKASTYDIHGKILVVDDSIDNRKLVQLLLANTDVTVTTAVNGKDALDKVLHDSFDLILMDMQMPIMDGIEATRQLRKSGFTVPIVALTANAMKHEKQKCFNAGCSDFLSKPIERKVFFNTLEKYLNLASNTDDTTDSSNNVDLGMYELEKEFVERLPDRAKYISDAFNAKDSQLVKSECHKLKGIAGAYGYQEITDLSSVIETSLKAGHEPSNIESSMSQLLDLCYQAPSQFAKKYAANERIA